MQMAPETISRRRFKSPYWDVPPVGYEHITPNKYKALQASGQVPHSVVNPSAQVLQSANRHPDPLAAAKTAAANITALLAAGGGAGGGAVSGNAKSGGDPASTGGNSKTMSPALTRQARRLYVGNIPFGTTDDEMIEFFESNMRACNFVKDSGNPVLACQINLEKNFAFLEFRSVEETSSALALDGILCKGVQALKIRRPHDYQPIPGSEPAPVPIGAAISGLLESGGPSAVAAAVNVLTSNDGTIPHIPGVVSTVVADSPNKIYIGGLPTSYTDENIKEILTTFGQLRAFNLIRDPVTLASKGYAFCEYLNPSLTDVAIKSLNGFDLGDKKLIVQRASVGSKSVSLSSSNNAVNLAGLNPAAAAILLPPVQIQVPGLQGIAPTTTPRVLTEVLCLMNMVEKEELKDDQEYQDIIEDIQEECSKYGTVKAIEIPRPSRDGNEDVPGLGKVFIEFDSPTEAQRAQLNLAGRRFAGHVVVTSFFDRDRFRNKEF